MSEGRLCECGILAVAREVKKEGPNQGKIFWCCSQPQGFQCKYFCFDGEESKDKKKEKNAIPNPSMTFSLKRKESKSPPPFMEPKFKKLEQVEEKKEILNEIKEIREKVTQLVSIFENSNKQS